MSYYETLLERKGLELPREITLVRSETPVLSIPTLRKPRRAKAFDPITGQRICCLCDLPKPPECYTTNKNNVDGKDARCKPCKSRIINQYNKSK